MITAYASGSGTLMNIARRLNIGYQEIRLAQHGYSALTIPISGPNQPAWSGWMAY